MAAKSIPGRSVLLWAVLIPLSYAPTFALGTRPGRDVLVALLAAIVIAAGAWLLLTRTRLLDRIATALEPHAGKLLWLAIVAHFGWSVYQSQLRVAAFADFNQLGLFSQSTWTQLHGHMYANSHETVDGSLGSHFGIHFSPTLLIVAPLYALFPSPLVLLGLQSLALSLIPLPLFHLLRHRISATAALVLALATLAIPAFALAGPLDFRDQNLLPVLLLGVLWAIETRNARVAFVLALAALGVREDAGLTLAVLGIYAMIRGSGVKVGLGMIALGVAWFVLVTNFVIPHFSSPGLWMDPKRFFVNVLGQWGDTPLAALQGMMSRPGELLKTLVSGDSARYLYALLLPLLGLPPFGDWAALVALPSLGINLLSRLPFLRDAAQGYSLIPLTFLALAAAMLAVRTAKGALPARQAGTAFALALVVLAGTLPALAIGHGRPAQPAPPAAAASRVVNLIPEREAVYAPVSLYPALCNREDFGCWWSTGVRGREPEFRARYAWIVLWPGSDPADESREQALAESLATDHRFVEHRGFEPFVVYQRSP
jgi:uncharacterized membrane protein